MLSPTDSLLLDAPPGSHFAQVHRTGESLSASVGDYLAAGLSRGDPAIVLAVPDHAVRFLRNLREAGIDSTRVLSSGQLQLLDADTCLSQFMVEGMPDWPRFRILMTDVLRKARTAGAGTLRAYGEMVDVLWRRGRERAAIRLEEFWNDLAREHAFTLFCTYLEESLLDSGGYEAIPDIGRTHAAILPTPEDGELRETLDRASRDLYGLPLSQLMGSCGSRMTVGESRLPEGQRSLLWIRRHLPASSVSILEAAKKLGRGRPT